jgi:hypothetical protein
VQLKAVGQELVQRRVEQADGHHEPRHLGEQPLEVALLEREQLIQSGVAAGVIVGHDHGPHQRLAIGGHEHVLGPAQSDSLGAKPVSAQGVLRRVGVGANAQRGQLWRTSDRARLERGAARVAGPVAELLLDPQQLVVLRHALGPRGSAGLDLTDPGGHHQVGNERVLGLA